MRGPTLILEEFSRKWSQSLDAVKEPAVRAALCEFGPPYRADWHLIDARVDALNVALGFPSEIDPSPR